MLNRRTVSCVAAQLVLVGALLFPSLTRADDGWVMTASTGTTFGIQFSTQAGRGLTLIDPNDGKSYAYFGTQNATDIATGGTAVFRSSDGVTWANITGNSFGSYSGGKPLTTDVPWLSTFAVAGKTFLMANAAGSSSFAGSSAPGARIYRANLTAPTVWTLVFSSNTVGNSKNTASVAGTAFNSAFYAGTKNLVSGGEVWKSTSADWTGAWIQVATAGFGVGAAGSSNVSYMRVFSGNGSLYASTNCGAAPCGQIWKSTGTVNPTDLDTWTQVLVASNTFDTTGNVKSVSVLESFGGFFYATTLNSTNGAKVWRTATPDTANTWRQVYTPDGGCSGAASGSCVDTSFSSFAGAAAQEVHSLNAIAGVLYASTWDPVSGTVVYRSTDGVTWVRSNAAAGFGNANNQYLGGFAAVGASVYGPTFNVPNNVQVWGAELPQPGSPQITALYPSSVTVSYATVGNTVNGYEVDASTAANFTGAIISSVTTQIAALSLSPQGLAANTTYFLRVAALWGAAAAFVNVVPASTSTLAVAPSSSAPSGVTASSITANWGANGNSPTTLYTAQVSTDNFATLNASSQTFNAFATFLGLTSNVTYYFRVQALGNNGALTAFTVLPSTMTMVLPPGLAVPTFSAVNLSSVAVQWTNGGNGAGVTYSAQISTDNFATINLSSVTANVSVLFGTGGAGSPLASNATYYFRVQTSSATNSSVFTGLGSTATLVATPTSAAPSNVSASSVTANWGANGNGPATLYTAQISTDNFATLNASSQTVNVFAIFSGLATNTTYYFKVQAMGFNGTLTAFTVLPSTLTLLPAPGLAAPAFTAVGLSSVSVQWINGGSGAGTIYTAQISTDNFATVNLSSVTSNLSVLFGTGGAGSALSPSTSYFFQVRASSGTNYSGFASLGSTSTLPAPPLPAAAPFSGVMGNTLQANWLANGDGTGTLYVAVLSTGASPSTNGFSGNATSGTANGFAVFGGLNGYTTYYVDVKAVNSNGFSSGVTGLGSTVTLQSVPGVPGTPLGTALGVSSITWTWSAAANATSYKVFQATSAVLLGTVAAPPFTVTSLSTNTSYSIVVAGINGGGQGPLSAGTTVSTLALPPTGLALGAVTASGITLSWFANGNPGGTSYRVDYWQATGSTASVTVSITTASIAGLSGGATYYLTVSALDLDGIATGSGIVVSTVTPPAPTATGSVGSSGGTIVFNPATGPVVIQIPSGAFASAVNVSVNTPASFPSAGSASGALLGTGIGIQITLDQAVQPAVGVPITISYRTTDIPGVDPTHLIIARYDDNERIWVPLQSSPNPANTQVTALTNHFSLFQLMQSVPSDGLSAIKAFPNPLRPALGQTTMTFINLPSNSRLRIYTLNGALVKDIAANAAGMASWDGTNQSGIMVASDVYFVYAQGNGKRRTLRVAIQR